MKISDKENFFNKRIHLKCKLITNHTLEYDWMSIPITKAEGYYLRFEEIDPKFFQKIAFLPKNKKINIASLIKSDDNIRKFINEKWVKNAPVDEILMADCIMGSGGSDLKARASYMLKMIDKGKEYLIPKLNEQLLQDLRITQKEISNAFNDHILISQVVNRLYDFDKIVANSTVNASTLTPEVDEKKDSEYYKKHFTNYLIFKFKELRGDKLKSDSYFNIALILIAPLFISIGYFASKAIKKYFNLLPKNLRTLKSLVGLEILLLVAKKNNIEQFLYRFATISIDAEEFDKIISFSKKNSRTKNNSEVNKDWWESNNRPWEKFNQNKDNNYEIHHGTLKNSIKHGKSDKKTNSDIGYLIMYFIFLFCLVLFCVEFF